MDGPSDDTVFPTDPNGLTPSTDKLDNVYPTPDTVEPMAVRLVAMLLTN